MLVVYLHDQCDVILEGTKLLMKLSFARPLARQVVEVAKNVGWVSFMLTWFYSRLYLYPLEAIMPSAVFGNAGDGANWFPFMLLLFVFLFLILTMNVYWGFVSVYVYVYVCLQTSKHMLLLLLLFASFQPFFLAPSS